MSIVYTSLIFFQIKYLLCRYMFTDSEREISYRFFFVFINKMGICNNFHILGGKERH